MFALQHFPFRDGIFRLISQSLGFGYITESRWVDYDSYWCGSPLTDICMRHNGEHTEREHDRWHLLRQSETFLEDGSELVDHFRVSRSVNRLRFAESLVKSLAHALTVSSPSNQMGLFVEYLSNNENSNTNSSTPTGYRCASQHQAKVDHVAPREMKTNKRNFFDSKGPHSGQPRSNRTNFWRHRFKPSNNCDDY